MPMTTAGPASRTTRLDTALVGRGLARSRAVAAEAIRAGRVRVDGVAASKPSHPVGPGTDLALDPDATSPWVSRAAGKLAPVLDLLRERGVDPVGRRCLDIGASTGGFTQVLLQRGATRVYSVDVGHGQLVADLAADARVVDLPGLHVRDLGTTHLDGASVDIAVADVSFISVQAVLAALPTVLARAGHAIVLVKPQFEAGRDALDKHGVVTDLARHIAVLHRVIDAAGDLGLSARGLWPSHVVGAHGNREYLLWLGHAEGPGDADHTGVRDRVPQVVAAAFEAGE